MFSGIIQVFGKIKDIKQTSGGAKFSFIVESFLNGSKIGDSIASNGVCLTIIELGNDYFVADLSKETLSLTNFQSAKVGDKINFEKSLTLNQGIDGHLVSGHVDGMAKIINKTASGDNIIFEIKPPPNLNKYIAKKGSITLNGISLTVNEITDDVFKINIVPHTLLATNLGGYRVGHKINIEVDIIARYLERLIKNEK